MLKMRKSLVTVDEHKKKVKEFINLCVGWHVVRVTYQNMAKSPNNSLDNAKTVDEQIYYAKIILDIYQKYFEKASEIKVPDFAKEEYNHYLDSIDQLKIACSCLINNDSVDYQKAAIKSKTEDALSAKEGEKIMACFNKEARSLRLPIPFPKLRKDSRSYTD